eukprot:m.61088 g.61088  ORF g.61088 m.61088 type:complete len:188 (-) comp22928_c1_seq1:26-589(-)
MGLIQSMMRELFKNQEARILMLGLDAAGKSTVLYKLKLGEVVQTVPTIGFNVETFSYKKLTMTVWDVGGQDRIRPLWRHYFMNNDALIYVVDSNDRERMEEARTELHTMLQEDELRDSLLLIFANKQDLPYAMTPSKMGDALALNSLGANRKWHIQPTNAINGEGLYEGLDWISSELKQHKKSLRLQ